MAAKGAPRSGSIRAQTAGSASAISPTRYRRGPGFCRSGEILTYGWSRILSLRWRSSVLRRSSWLLAVGVHQSGSCSFQDKYGAPTALGGQKLVFRGGLSMTCRQGGGGGIGGWGERLRPRVRVEVDGEVGRAGLEGAGAGPACCGSICRGFGAVRGCALTRPVRIYASSAPEWR